MKPGLLKYPGGRLWYKLVHTVCVILHIPVCTFCGMPGRLVGSAKWRGVWWIEVDLQSLRTLPVHKQCYEDELERWGLGR